MWKRFMDLIEYNRKQLAKADGYNLCWTLMCQCYGAAYMFQGTEQELEAIKVYETFVNEVKEKIAEVVK